MLVWQELRGVGGLLHGFCLGHRVCFPVLFDHFVVTGILLYFELLDDRVCVWRMNLRMYSNYI